MLLSLNMQTNLPIAVSGGESTGSAGSSRGAVMRYASVTSGASIPSKIIIHTLSVLPSSPVWLVRVNPTLISGRRFKFIYTMSN